MTDGTVLFWTCTNKAYEDFAPLYIASVLHCFGDEPSTLGTARVPNVKVEIGLEDANSFRDANKDALETLTRFYGARSWTVRTVDWNRAGRKVLPNSVRFLTEPETKAALVYIGDIDIIIADRSLIAKHLAFMRRSGLPYSNAKRETDAGRLTGLHFTRWDAYYPIPSVSDDEVRRLPDEVLLHLLVTRRGHAMPTEYFRPVGGLHVSPNRRPEPHVNERGRHIPGWAVGGDSLREWRRFRSEPVMQALLPSLSGRIRGIASVLDGMADALDTDDR